jgi:hypothetical protein
MRSLSRKGRKGGRIRPKKIGSWAIRDFTPVSSGLDAHHVTYIDTVAMFIPKSSKFQN